MPDFVRPLNLKKPIVNRKLIAWGFLLTGLVSTGAWVWGRTRLAPAAPPAQTWGQVKITYTVNPPSPSPVGQRVLVQLQTQLATASGEYGIYVYRLPDKVGYGLGADRVFRAPAVTKILQLVNKTAADLRMQHTDPSQNTTTAYDAAMLWKGLYEAKLLGPLGGSSSEGGILAAVPPGVQVIHQMSATQESWADSGIVMASKPFVMVILSSQPNSPQIQQLGINLVKTIWLAETSGPR